MKLLIIRHAIAEDREDFARTGKDDSLRPISDEGKKKMKQGARGLRPLVPEIVLLAPSPLLHLLLAFVGDRAQAVVLARPCKVLPVLGNGVTDDEKLHAVTSAGT